MPLVTDELQEKKDTLFLKYEPENILYLKSQLYKILSHYLKGMNKSVACKGKECVFCKNGYDRRIEYNYYVSLNGQLGMINIKPSVFFQIQAIAKASKKETRQMNWLVIKQGQGLDTEYIASKNENLTDEEWEKTKAEVSLYTEKLSALMQTQEVRLEKNYELLKSQATPQKKKETTTPDEADRKWEEGEKKEEPAPPIENPEEIPF